MTKTEISRIREELSILVGQPLRKLYRCGGASVFMSYGEDVEVDTICLNENGKLKRDEKGKFVMEKGLAPKYALHTECSMRLTCDNEVIVAKSDIFLPATKLLKEGTYDPKTYDWDIYGNNYFDELVSKYVTDEPFDFIVEKISVSKFGDLTISFKNGFVLEFFADSSDDSEIWRFFDAESEDCHLVVTGNGIEGKE